MDQPPGGGVGAVRFGAGRAGLGSSDHQRGLGGAPPHCGRGGHRGPRRHTHQLQRGEAAHASTGLLPRRPARSHLRRLQHVSLRRTGLCRSSSAPSLEGLGGAYEASTNMCWHPALCDTSISWPLHACNWFWHCSLWFYILIEFLQIRQKQHLTLKCKEKLCLSHVFLLVGERVPLGVPSVGIPSFNAKSSNPLKYFAILLNLTQSSSVTRPPWSFSMQH